MHYEFPAIEGFDDVKGCIDPDFFIVKRDDRGIFVNYKYSTTETFPLEKSWESSVRREFRGISFSVDGKLVNRKYHKFFNLDERPDVGVDSLDFSKKFWVLDKLDGSMITPFPYKGKLEMHTKMGATDVAAPVTSWVEDKKNYIDFMWEMLNEGFTPIFEWISPSNRIVIDYEDTNLVLTAIRHNITGEYVRYDRMVEIAKSHAIPVVKALNELVTDFDGLVRHIKNIEGSEGVVVRFDDGHMVKIKSEWYVRIHNAINNVTNEKKVIGMFLDGTLDDVIPYLPGDVKKEVEDFTGDYMKKVRDFVNKVWNIRNDIMSDIDTDDVRGFRKAYAMSVNSKYKSLATFLFAARDMKDISEMEEYIIDYTRKNLSTNEKLNRLLKTIGARMMNRIVSLD